MGARRAGLSGRQKNGVMHGRHISPFLRSMDRGVGFRVIRTGSWPLSIKRAASCDPDKPQKSHDTIHVNRRSSPFDQDFNAAKQKGALDTTLDRGGSIMKGDRKKAGGGGKKVERKKTIVTIAKAKKQDHHHQGSSSHLSLIHI